MAVTITSRNLVFEPVKESMIIRASDYKGFEQSFFSEALAYAAEAKSEIRECSKTLYKTIAEATTDEVVTEAFSDFGKKVKDIVGKFIEFLKKLFSRFITLLNKIISSDKYIKKNKELFAKFTKEDSFTVERYNYTYLTDPKYPNAMTLTEFDTEVDALSGNFDQVVAGSNVNLQLDNFYGEFRYRVVHPEDDAPKGTISQDRYAKVLSDLFRDGGVKKSVKVDPTLVSYAYTRFADYEQTIKSIKTVKQELEDQYNKIKISMERVLDGSNSDKITLKGKSYDSENRHKLESLSKQYVDKISQMTQIHAMAFSAKLDAVTECFKADKVLLYKALNKIQGFKHEAVSDLGVDVDENDPYLDLIGESLRYKADSMFDQVETLSEYADFLISESASQNDMIRYINTEIFGESSYKMHSITEAGGAGAKVKNTINRIVTLISQIFAKFVEFMNKVFKNDKAYLERYKNIILQKKLVQAEVKMNDYEGNGAFKFLQSQIIHFMDNSTQKDIKYADLYYKALMIQVNQQDDKTLKAYVMEKYVGEAVDIDTSKINMTDVYNYIYSFDKLKDSIAADIKTLNQESSKINTILDKHMVEVKGKEDAKAAEAAAAAGKAEPKAESATFTFESTMRKYFSETFDAKPSDAGGDTKVNTSGTAATPDQNKSIGNNAPSTSETKDEGKARVEKLGNDVQSVDNSKELTELETQIKDYYDATRDYLACKMEIAKMIYNDYFKLIRWHVRNNVGQGENETDKSTTKGTDYSSGNQTKQPEASTKADAGGGNVAQKAVDGIQKVATGKNDDPNGFKSARELQNRQQK